MSCQESVERKPRYAEPRGYDVMGHHYGALLPVERLGSDVHGSALWRCICDPRKGGCGCIVEVTYRALDAYKRHCGCIRRRRASPGSVRIAFEGRTLNTVEWAHEMRQRGILINGKAIACRLRDGWSVDEALTTPLAATGRARA